MSENKINGKDEKIVNKFIINGHYVKDLSFENPNAPASLFNLKQKPKIDLNLDLRARKLQDKTFEIVLNVNAKASAEDNALFIAELSYAGVFTIKQEMSEDEEKRTLLVDCANVIFPFARRVIADTTRDGGYAPLMLDSVDFYKIYQEQEAKGGIETSAEGEENGIVG
jgi:preprotein translocase subunit SecB